MRTQADRYHERGEGPGAFSCAGSLVGRVFGYHARRWGLLAVAVSSCALFAAPEDRFPAHRAEMVAQTGWVGIFDTESKDLFASLELRLAQNWHGIRPWGGITLVESGAWFCGAGFIYDVRLTQKFRLTLGSGPFYYRSSHEGNDLGFDLEFYSFFELSRVCGKGDGRIGFRLGHLSNAGLGRKNPGTETLAVVWSIPFPRSAAD